MTNNDGLMITTREANLQDYVNSKLYTWRVTLFNQSFNPCQGAEVVYEAIVITDTNDSSKAVLESLNMSGLSTADFDTIESVEIDR